jgi:peptidoglycan-N-acetylglucosamine deacetylase
MVMQDFDAYAGVAATRTNTTITPVRIGCSVHYGAPEIAHAISNHLKQSLGVNKCKLWPVLRGNGAFAFAESLVSWQASETMTARRVTLTFDNGPTSRVTERVLDVLQQARILATFFVIGRKLDDSAAASLMKQAHKAGHWIGNHTLSHTVALGDRPDLAYAVSEIEGAQQRIGECAHPEKLFRPYGNSGLIGPHLLSRSALDHLIAQNYRTVIWNNVPGDWKDANGWVDNCIAKASAQDWSVVVLHDIASGCLSRLPELLRRFEDLGVTYEQDFPDAVTLTRAGGIVSHPQSCLADQS